MVSHRGSQRWRKSEATTNRDEGHAPNRRDGGRIQVLKETHHGDISDRMGWLKKRNGRVEMRAPPLLSRQTFFY